MLGNDNILHIPHWCNEFSAPASTQHLLPQADANQTQLHTHIISVSLTHLNTTAGSTQPQTPAYDAFIDDLPDYSRML